MILNGKVADKIIRGLECCDNSLVELNCESCPFSELDNCEGRLHREALVLLRSLDMHNTAQWTTRRTARHDGEWYCSHCGYEPEVFVASRFCPECGYEMHMETTQYSAAPGITHMN